MDFDEFATAREELLLRIMKFVEESGTSLASPSQTLYLSGDAASKSKKEKIEAAVTKLDKASSVPDSPERSQSESAVPSKSRNTGENDGKDD
jgi:MscS family membrane protein